MCHKRFIGCYDRATDRHIKDIALRPVALTLLQALFKAEFEWERDPLVGYVYVIGPVHAAALAPYVAEPFDLERYEYFLESSRPAHYRTSIMSGGPENLIAEFVDDSEHAYLSILKEDGTPDQGVIAQTKVYRSEDVPDLRAVNIQLGWSDDLTACWVQVGDLYRELKVPDRAGPHGVGLEGGELDAAGGFDVVAEQKLAGGTGG